MSLSLFFYDNDILQDVDEGRTEIMKIEDMVFYNYSAAPFDINKY